MRWFSRSLTLAVASLGLLGLVGCGEDNEKAGGGDTTITKPANAPSPEDYNKAMSKGGGAGATEENKGASPTIPGSTAPPASPTP